MREFLFLTPVSFDQATVDLVRNLQPAWREVQEARLGIVNQLLAPQEPLKLNQLGLSGPQLTIKLQAWTASPPERTNYSCKSTTRKLAASRT